VICACRACACLVVLCENIPMWADRINLFLYALGSRDRDILAAFYITGCFTLVKHKSSGYPKTAVNGEGLSHNMGYDMVLRPVGA